MTQISSEMTEEEKAQMLDNFKSNFEELADFMETTFDKVHRAALTLNSEDINEAVEKIDNHFDELRCALGLLDNFGLIEAVVDAMKIPDGMVVVPKE